MRSCIQALRACAVALVLVGVGCNVDVPAPTQPGFPSGSVQPGSTDLAVAIRAQIELVFASLPRRIQARQHFMQIETAWARGDTAEARSKAGILFTHTLQQLEAGQLSDPDGGGPETPASGALTLFNLVLAFTGQPFTEPGANSSATLVLPSDDEQTIDSGLDLLVRIPGGSLSAASILLIDRDDTGATIGEEFDTASDLYEVRFVPEIAFEELTVGICIFPTIPVGARLAHGLSTGDIDLLEPATIPLACTTDGHASAGSTGGGPWGTLAALGRRAVGLFVPTVAYAGHAALAGTVFELSPFQAVNTGTTLESTVNAPTYGGTANISATLAVANSEEPLAGRSLTLTIGESVISSAVTGPSGIASWSVPATAVAIVDYTIDFGGELTPLGDVRFAASSTTGSYTVEKAPLTLTASSASYVVGSGAPMPSCVVTYTGLVNGDTPASLGALSTCSYPPMAGVHTILPTLITPANYVVTREAGTFTLTPAALIGSFLSPLPMSEITAGSKLPVHFSLTTASGVAVANRAIALKVVNTSGFVRQLGLMAYKAGPKRYESNVKTAGWPVGLVRIVATLNDGTEWSVMEVVK